MRFVKDNPWTAATITFFGAFWIVSATTGFEPGEAIGRSFASFLFDMLLQTDESFSSSINFT